MPFFGMCRKGAFKFVANRYVYLTIIEYIKVDIIRLNFKCHIKPVQVRSDLILVHPLFPTGWALHYFDILIITY